MKEAGHDASIEEGGKGQFDVLADEKRLFSKKEQGRFPETAEIRALLG